MGDYQEVMNKKESLRPLDPEEEERGRRPLFGNPFKKVDQKMMLADEANEAIVSVKRKRRRVDGGQATPPGSPQGLESPLGPVDVDFMQSLPITPSEMMQSNREEGELRETSPSDPNPEGEGREDAMLAKEVNDLLNLTPEQKKAKALRESLLQELRKSGTGTPFLHLFACRAFFFFSLTTVHLLQMLSCLPDCES